MNRSRESETEETGLPVISTNEAGNTVFTLKCGGKQLTVELTPYGDAKSFLENLENTGGIKNPGETTMLYEQARRWMVEEATRRGQPIRYEMETGFTRMIDWLKTSGNRIFGWERVYQTIDDPQKIKAITTIYPREK